MPRIASANTKELTNAAAGQSRRPPAPTPEEIRVRAFAIYVANGAQTGHEARDWAQAEKELRARVMVISR